MSKIRSVYPSQWTDENFVTCSPLARLLALAIRNEADDNGIFCWRPLQLKMRCLPADNCDVTALLDELVRTEQVYPYELDGKQYGLIRGFTRWQHPTRPYYAYPVPEELPEGYKLAGAPREDKKRSPKEHTAVRDESMKETSPAAGTQPETPGNAVSAGDLFTAPRVLPPHSGGAESPGEHTLGKQESPGEHTPGTARTVSAVRSGPHSSLLSPARREEEIGGMDRRKGGEREGGMHKASPSALPSPRRDPLDPYPVLKEFYPVLMEHLREHHPNYRVPAGGTQVHWESRKVLADLVRLDGFPETDVAACLDWLFTASHPDADFWRKQVQGIKPLRVARGTEMTKFGKIHEQWLGRNGEKGRDRACKVTYAADDPFAIPADG